MSGFGVDCVGEGVFVRLCKFRLNATLMVPKDPKSPASTIHPEPALKCTLYGEDSIIWLRIKVERTSCTALVLLSELRVCMVSCR